MPRQYVDINSIDMSKFQPIDNVGQQSNVRQPVDLSKLDLSKFEPIVNQQDSVVTKEEPGYLQSGLRKIARVGEAAGGLPGDIASGALGLANYATGGAIPTYEKIQEKLPLSLPTSSQARQSLKKVTGEYLEPETDKDSFWDNVVSDFGSYMVPIGGAVKGSVALGRAIGGNVASKAAESLGFGEAGQAISKLAFNVSSMFPGSKSYFTKKSNEAYDAARSSIAKGAKESSVDLEKTLDKWHKYVNSGDKSTPSKVFLRDRINAAGDHIAKDKIPVDQAWALKKDFNKLIGDKATPLDAKKGLREMVSSLNKTLSDYGKVNPDFGSNFNAAEDIYKGLHKASKVNEFFQENTSLKNILKNKLVKGLFGAGLYKSGVGAPGAIAGIGTAYGVGQTIKTAEFIKNSKEARKIYGEILKSSLAGDVANAGKYMKQLNQIADTYDRKENK